MWFTDAMEHAQQLKKTKTKKEKKEPLLINSPKMDEPKKSDTNKYI